MSGWLTTGQMIDYLIKNPGTRAESERGKVVEYSYGDMRLIEVTNGDNTVECHRLFVTPKWRILPNFISFDEAMKALKEGKSVRFYVNGREVIWWDLETNQAELYKWFYDECLTFNDLLNGKFTIEG